MANELDRLFSDTSGAKQNLKEAGSKVQGVINRIKEIQAQMESLRQKMEAATAEYEEQKAEYERLAAELAALSDDDDDEEGQGNNFARRQAIMGQMLAAQQRYQKAERDRQAYQQQLESKKKQLQQMQNELNMLRIRLQNLIEMFEDLKRRYEKEKETNRQAAARFASIQGNRFGQSAGAGRNLAISKQNICDRGVNFCNNEKQIAEGWIKTIDESQSQMQQRQQGDGARDF